MKGLGCILIIVALVVWSLTITAGSGSLLWQTATRKPYNANQDEARDAGMAQAAIIGFVLFAIGLALLIFG